MKENTAKYLITLLLLVVQTHVVNAESEFYTTDYKSLVYITMPFGGGQANYSPKLGFITTMTKFNQIQTVMNQRDPEFSSIVYNKRLIDLTYDFNSRRWSRFTLGGINALDINIPYANVIGGGINPMYAVLGAGLVVGAIVASDAASSDSDNHACEAHDEEEHHDEFTSYDIVFNVHPCPEEEENGDGDGH